MAETKTRIEELEHDGDMGPKPRPIDDELPERSEPKYADRQGAVFRDLDGEADDEENTPEPKGFDPIKSRYLESDDESTASERGTRRGRA